MSKTQDTKTDIWASVDDDMLQAVDEYAEEETEGSRAEATREALDRMLCREGKRYTQIYPVDMRFAEFTARMIGNRLWELGEIYEEDGRDREAQEVKMIARRFHSECNTRK